MQAITARYYGPTDHRGSRIRVQDGHTTRFYSYDSAASDPFDAAIATFTLDEPTWDELFHKGYRYITGGTRGGDVVAVWYLPEVA